MKDLHKEKEDRAHIDTLLSTDPLGEAEKMTGKSYKEDAATSALGFGVSLALGKHKKKALSEAGDTFFDIPLAKFKNLLEQRGFIQVFNLKPETPIKDNPNAEAYVYYHPEHPCIITFDVFYSSINGGHIMFTGKPIHDDYQHLPRSSGGFVNATDAEYDSMDDWNKEDVRYNASYDIREGLFHWLDDALKKFEFQPILSRPVLGWACWFLKSDQSMKLDFSDRMDDYNSAQSKFHNLVVKAFKEKGIDYGLPSQKT